MKFRPLHDRVVVKRIEAEEKTAGGITLQSRRHQSRIRTDRRSGHAGFVTVNCQNRRSTA